MTLQSSKVVYVEGNPSLKGPWGWTTFTNLIQEVGPHSQLSSKRLDHIHQISSKRLDHINKSHSRIFIHVWSWNYDYLDKDDTTILALFFLTNVDMKLFNIFFFLTYAYMKFVLLDCRNSSKVGGGGGVFTYFLKSTVKTKLNAHSHRLVGWRNNFTLIACPFLLWVDYKNSKRFF
jgi:hypothetical protein